MKTYPIWSYFNIIAIDAPIISVLWYFYYAQNSINEGLNAYHFLILGFSVWLGYMADRLLDVRFKQKSQLVSLRHQFCKEHERKLWILWVITLIITLGLSLNTLNSDKIFAGLKLVLFIFFYNCLNQCFSRKRFPKELIVAALFAYGTLFLVEKPFDMEEFLHFTLICFLNCLILTHKDKLVDDKMGVRSWTHPLKHQSITIINVLLGIYFILAYKSIDNAYFAICIACLLIHTLCKDLNAEQFRVVIESIYALIPLIMVICLR